MSEYRNTTIATSNEAQTMAVPHGRPMRRPPPPPPLPPPPPPPIRTTSLRIDTSINTNSATKVASTQETATPQGLGQQGGNSSLTAAADLIRTLDSAFAEMSSLSACAAKDADDARRNARAASEMARRYTSRSFPNAMPTTTSTTTAPMRLELHPPLPMPPESPTSKSLVTSPNRKRKNQRPPSSAERLAQSHVEDVLAVSLELERTKQELENERRDHDRAKMGNTEYKTKTQQLEAQMVKLLEEMERQREDHGRRIDSLQDELARHKTRLHAADEDAQAALDLAQDAANSKQQVESWLQKALQEIELLRNQLDSVGVHDGSVMPTTPAPKKHSVRFAESPTVLVVPNQDTDLAVVPQQTSPARTMVAAGRRVLGLTRSPDPKLHMISISPQKSAERRQILRDRLKALNEDNYLPPTPQKDVSPPKIGVEMNSLAQQAMDACYSISSILKESAWKLKLAGRWAPSTARRDDVEHVENLARRYCNAVESRIQRHDTEINDLSSLCMYLEDKLAMNNGSLNHADPK